MRTRRLLSLVVGLALATAAASSASRPITVSPGDPSEFVPISDPCPTFSWGTVTGASDYELVIYHVTANGEDPLPVLRVDLPGTAHSWTPSLEQCLARGERYAWSVRVTEPAGASRVSEVRLFQVGSIRNRGNLEEPSSILDHEITAAPVESAAPVQLIVEGALQGEDFVFPEPRLGIQTVQASMFQPDDSSLVRHRLGIATYLSAPDTQTTYNATAPLYLPQGARMTLVFCEAWDNDPDNSAIWKVKVCWRQRSTRSLVCAAGDRTLTIDSVLASDELLEASFDPYMIVNYPTFTPMLRLEYERDFGTANTNLLRFYGCEVSYEISRVDSP